MTANNYNYTKLDGAVQKVGRRFTKQGGIVKEIIAGWTKRNGVVEQVYKKISAPYEPGHVLYDSSSSVNYPAGTSLYITLYPGCIYEIEGVAGGGSSCAGKYAIANPGSTPSIGNVAAAGGSGSAFKVRIKCNQQVTYSCKAGKGGAKGSTPLTRGEDGEGTNAFNIKAYGGGKGNYSGVRGQTVDSGLAGAQPSIPSAYGAFWELVQTIYSTPGNPGEKVTTGTAAGGAAIIENYGKGGDAQHSANNSININNSGNDGYLKITYIGPA